MAHLQQVLARLGQRRRLLGLASTLRWGPAEGWARCLRVLGRPAWRWVGRRRDDVLEAMPGRDPERLRGLIADATGLLPEPWHVDVGAYRRYVEQARYPRGCYGPERHLGSPFHEKTLEHFVAFELLGLRPGQVYLDVASNLSPVPDVARRLFGCTALRQDLCYRKGRHGDLIGGTASSIPLESGSVDAITLHCAFEHFEGGEDSAFIREAARLLRPGGRLVILPLYLAEAHTLVTNRLFGGPALDDPGTELRLRVRRRDSVFSRFYHPARLRERVLDVTPLRPRFLYVENQDAVARSCYLKFVLVLAQAPARPPGSPGVLSAAAPSTSRDSGGGDGRSGC